jgi:hypothetical protein
LTAVVRPRDLAFGLGAFGLGAFGLGGGFAAALPLASAFAAAVAALFAGRSRFALRFPGRELGRFPSTPPSSVMDGDSSSAHAGYTEGANEDDRVVRSWIG